MGKKCVIDGNFFIIQGKLESIRNEGRTLSGQDDIDSFLDIVKIDNMVYRIIRLIDKILIIADFQRLVLDMENEKDKFLVHKKLKKYSESLVDFLDDLIEDGRLQKYDDYRCIDWIKRLIDILVDAREFFGQGKIFIREVSEEEWNKWNSAKKRN